MVIALDADGEPVARASGFLFTPPHGQFSAKDIDFVAEDTASPQAADRSSSPDDDHMKGVFREQFFKTDERGYT
jgi:hypothetical protein